MELPAYSMSILLKSASSRRPNCLATPLKGGESTVADTAPRCSAFNLPCWLSATDIKTTSLPGSKPDCRKYETQRAVGGRAGPRACNNLSLEVVHRFYFRCGKNNIVELVRLHCKYSNIDPAQPSANRSRRSGGEKLDGVGGDRG